MEKAEFLAQLLGSVPCIDVRARDSVHRLGHVPSPQLFGSVPVKKELRKAQCVKVWEA